MLKVSFVTGDCYHILGIVRDKICNHLTGNMTSLEITFEIKQLFSDDEILILLLKQPHSLRPV
jgi:hypothetical protein